MLKFCDLLECLDLDQKILILSKTARREFFGDVTQFMCDFCPLEFRIWIVQRVTVALIDCEEVVVIRLK